MNTTRPAPSFVLLGLLLAAPVGAAAQSVLVEAKTTAGDEVATIRTDSMRLLVPLHLLVGGLLFPDGTLQTTAAGGPVSVTSAEIVDGTIVNADISASAAIADTKLGTITSAGKVANSATTATSANTAGAIVARDAAGGFGADYVAVGDSLQVGGSLLVTGTYNYATTVPPPVSGAGQRMMWYPEKAAFRAGSAAGNEWDASNVGNFSAALGRGTMASGTNSIALGYNTIASGSSSTAFGANTTASGTVSNALGQFTTASGAASIAAGYGSTASGSNSAAFGANTTASGTVSTAFGTLTTAAGVYSTAIGYGATAQSYASVAIGRYNVAQGNATTWSASDPLFVAGNGAGDNYRQNALTLYKNGNLTIAGTLTQSSDARLKEDIEPLEGTLERVLRLTPIRYHFRTGTGRPEGTQLGLTAQEVQPLFPELVKQDGDGYLSLSYANLSAVLVKAVQEQQAEVEALRARAFRQDEAIAALRRRNERLEAELAALRDERGTAEARVARLEALVEKLVSARAKPHRHPDDPQDPR